MPESGAPQVAIVDYGMGNLHSVRQACHAAGLRAAITGDKDAVLGAEAVIIPGVGAFGDAMETLRRLDLVSPLRDLAAAGVPLIGICLGMQLFMSESEEFGRHEGLAFFPGPVVRFNFPGVRAGGVKVPQVGWNRIHPAPGGIPWSEWPLQGIEPGEFMYFVHSYHAKPEDPRVIFSLSNYGGMEFCSSVKRRNIFACQFHPERSGAGGLALYRNIASHIMTHRRIGSKAHV